ncbi:MAG TPA: patatin-like phospholipase family protein [Myxococcota bacterium]|nr:patatin-like phospholipase family protein [Myxococcota bacterium]
MRELSRKRERIGNRVKAPLRAGRGERKRLGLALGAGGARGLAHAGVLFGLTEAGVAIDAIAGTSIGALIGALWATGQLEFFERELRSTDRSDLVRYLDPVWPRSGLLSGERATEYLRSLIGDWRIEDLPIAFAAVAVDLVSGEEIWIREGRLLDAVRASISLPGIFVPVRQGSRVLVDGAIRNPVPISPLEALGVDVRVAVNLQAQPVRELEPRTRRHSVVSRIGDAFESGLARLGKRSRVRDPAEPEPPAGPNLIEVLSASMSVLEHEIAKHRLAREPVDVVLTPELGSIRLLEFHKSVRAVSAGRAELEAKLPEIQAALRKRAGLARYFSLGSSS